MGQIRPGAFLWFLPGPNHAPLRGSPLVHSGVLMGYRPMQGCLLCIKRQHELSGRTKKKKQLQEPVFVYLHVSFFLTFPAITPCSHSSKYYYSRQRWKVTQPIP